MRAICFIVLVGFCCCLPTSLSAQPDSLAFERLKDSNQFSDFLIRVLHRDRAGFLWAGTHRGLDRFDGLRVRPNPVRTGQLRTDDIFSLAESPDNPGFLWVGTREGGLSYFDPRKDSLSVVESTSIDSASISSLLIDAQNRLWIGTAASGLYRLDTLDQPIVRIPLMQQTTSRADSILAIADSPEALWISTRFGLFKYQYGIDSIELVEIPSLNSAVTAIAAKGGYLWLGTEQRSVFRHDPGTNETSQIQQLRDLERISAIVESSVFDHVLWIGTRDAGLVAFNVEDGNRTAYAFEEKDATSLFDNDVQSVIEDHEGILWVGTATGGINKAILEPRFGSNRAQAFPITQSLDRPVFALHQLSSNNNNIWFSHGKEGLGLLDRVSGQLEMASVPEALSGMFIMDIHEDINQDLWLAGDKGLLYKFDPDQNLVQRANLGIPKTDAQIRRIQEWTYRPGFLWLASRRMGLLLYDVQADSVVQRFTKEGGQLNSNDVWQVVESDDPRTIWVAQQNGGISRIETIDNLVESWTHHEMPACLPTDDILSVYPAPDSTIWAGTVGHGLIRFDFERTECSQYLPVDGLAHQDVSAIFPDRLNRIWVVTQEGVALLDPSNESITPLTQEDDIVSRAIYYQAHHITNTGEVLIGGDKGFNVLRPAALELDTAPKPVVISELWVNGEPRPLVQTSMGYEPIYLSYDQQDIEFHFASLDLRQPDLHRFRMKRESSVEWEKLGNESIMRYRSLLYDWNTFLLGGTNRDGVWNEAAFPLEVHVTPPFWETWWFWMTMATMLVGLVVFIYQGRLNLLLRVEKTRKSIAKDLHDEMGSRLSSLALQIEMAGMHLDPTDATRSRLSELADLERGLVKDLRTIVWLINTDFDSLPKLLERMEQFAGQILKRFRFTFEKPEEIPDIPLGMHWRKHFFLLYKEALHNTLRHSNADHVSIEIRLENLNLHLTIEDDGNGFDVEKALKGQGLSSMEERAKAIGATLNINSIKEEGTSIDLQVSLAEKRPKFGVFTRWRKKD